MNICMILKEKLLETIKKLDILNFTMVTLET